MKSRVKNKKIYPVIAFMLILSMMLGACGGANTVSDNNVSDNSVSGDRVSADEIAPVAVSVDTVIDNTITMTTGAQTEADTFESTLYDNYYLYQDLSGPSLPTGMAGEVISGYSRDILFANGTPVMLLESTADVSGYIHDDNVQTALGNDLSADNTGYGAIAVWQDGSLTRYVYLSNMAEVYGGSYRETVLADVDIAIFSTEGSKSSPNISYVFGGGMYGDVVGDVSISVNDALPMYLYGGGYNGSIYGNINVSYTGNSWSSEIVGGGLARPFNSDVKAIVYGDIELSVDTHDSSVENIICGGGFAESTSLYASCSDVFGSTRVSVSGQNVYELVGGGISYCSDEGLYASSNVLGDTYVYMTNGKLQYNSKSGVVNSGVLVTGGLTYGGIAIVEGSATADLKGVTFDRGALGVVPGGICNAVSMNAVADVRGGTVVYRDKANKEYRIAYEPDEYLAWDKLEADDTVSDNDVADEDEGFEIDYGYDDVFNPDFIMSQFFSIARLDLILDMTEFGIEPGVNDLDLKKYAGLASSVKYTTEGVVEAQYLLFICFNPDEAVYELCLYDVEADSFTYIDEPDFTNVLFECINIVGVENLFVNKYFALAHGGQFDDSLEKMIKAGLYACYEEKEINDNNKNVNMHINYPMPAMSLIWADEF